MARSSRRTSLIGLRLTARRLPVERWVSPEAFADWAKEGEAMGFAVVAAGPLVRSSYRAGEYFIERMLHGRA